MESIEFGEAMAKLGLRSQVIKSGRYKDVLSPFRQMLPEERALLENMVMEVYEQFVGDVVAGRPKMGEKAVREVADGRVFSGQTALKIGLVDQIGGYREALRKAAELGGLPHAGELPPVIYEDGRGGWVQRLLSESLSFMRPVSQAVRPGVTMKFIYQPGL
jgi:protease-4